MISFLSSSTFRFLLLPLFTTILAFMVKLCCKKDNIWLFTREDFSVGPNISSTAIFILMSKCAIVANDAVSANNYELASKSFELVIEMLVILFVFLFGLLGMTILIRRLGWERINERHRLKIGWGIIFPNLIGIIYLIVAFTKSIKI